MASPEALRWFDEAVDDLGEVGPSVEGDHPAALAFVDRVLAHAEATGRLERVTYDGAMTVCCSDGGTARVEPGVSVVILDRAGRAYRLCAR